MFDTMNVSLNPMTRSVLVHQVFFTSKEISVSAATECCEGEDDSCSKTCTSDSGWCSKVEFFVSGEKKSERGCAHPSDECKEEECGREVTIDKKEGITGELCCCNGDK